MFKCVVARSLGICLKKFLMCMLLILNPFLPNGFVIRNSCTLMSLLLPFLWGLWLNRNNLVFNKTTWINVKQVWRMVFFLLRDWKKPFKDLESGRNAQFMDLLLASLKAPLCLPVGWSAPPSTGSPPGIRTTKGGRHWPTSWTILVNLTRFMWWRDRSTSENVPRKKEVHLEVSEQKPSKPT
jgi:hypothetical protein